MAQIEEVTFAGWLRGLLDEHGRNGKPMPQEEAARRVGCSLMTVNRLVTGKEQPSYDTLVKILRAFPKAPLPPDLMRMIRQNRTSAVA